MASGGDMGERAAEIAAQRAAWQPTRRTVAAGLEELLYRQLPVLDHGFLRVIDYMGDDGAIVQAARVSYGRGTRSARSDAGLIGYLMRHRHSTPFEMCEIKYHVKLPIFVARQWIRHRTANVNEYSARYSILDREFYLPPPEALAAQSQANGQGRGQVLAGEEAALVLETLKRDAESAFDHYEAMLSQNGDGRRGLARELARLNLPLATYTQWYWKTDLHNLFHFLTLRADPHAQHEIRAYAATMLETVKAWVPLAFAAFMENRMEGAQLSAGQLAVIRRLIAGERVTEDSSGLPRRIWNELQAVLEE